MRDREKKRERERRDSGEEDALELRRRERREISDGGAMSKAATMQQPRERRDSTRSNGRIGSDGSASATRLNLTRTGIMAVAGVACTVDHDGDA
ncbi:hypothetical protein Scep_028192 [Stephania cephalantha]|uniref:Uncharacterized protein n=1 Tax=Stephania cephalantha TaxID=152367 RepID=A0AAP0E9E1_9MAGN